MIRTALPAVLAAAVLVFAGTNFTARGQESKDDEAFQQRLFGRALDGTQIHACFSRIYDAAHLPSIRDRTFAPCCSW
jgi:hypothetical protein